MTTNASTPRKQPTQAPGPAEYRVAFPAHSALATTHQLVTPDGSKHLRNTYEPLTYREGGNRDAPLCSTGWRAPAGSTYNIPCHGRKAIAETTCTACALIGARMLEDAAHEVEEINRAARALKANLSLLDDMRQGTEAEEPR